MTDKKEVRDTGTKELSKHHTIIPRLKANKGYDYDLYVADSIIADKLLLDGMVNVNEHAILMAYVVVLHRADMIGPKGPRYEKGSFSDPSFAADKAAENIWMVTRINKILDKKIGPTKRRALMNICLSVESALSETLSDDIDALAMSLDEARFG